MEHTAAVILAAGEGKRMHSCRPKVLQEVLFKPMIDWVLDATADAGIPSVCVVTGFGREQLEARLAGRCVFAVQEKQLGTGHAVLAAEAFLKTQAPQDVVVLYGDVPFLDAAILKDAYAVHRQDGNAVTLITARLDDPHGYGRIVRDEKGNVLRIVEEKDANEEQRRIREVNSGAYWFRTDALLTALAALGNENAQGEYYLTDTVEILAGQGQRGGIYVLPNAYAMAGANDRRQLAALNAIARRQKLDALYDAGVEIVDESGVIVGPDVQIEHDTRLLPGTILRGCTTVGKGCLLGPNTLLEDCAVADGAVINASQAYHAAIGSGVTVGPFCHLRPGTHLEEKVHVGDFVELKNTHIGAGTKVPHLSYVGDADVGAGVNFGCGCVTANYDSLHKHRTTVGDHAFIGCHTNLIAPVTVGENAFTAAGSTITKDVPDASLAVERAKQVNLNGWVRRRHPERFPENKENR
ncbi:MAG: bifunctional UDP-N-acetylglucosamine diphosphorylase/glucosamine-1-phosphate N-acetyltransferase GlmU [Ethanoligenens sp.]